MHGHDPDCFFGDGDEAELVAIKEDTFSSPHGRLRVCREKELQRIFLLRHKLEDPEES